VSNISVDYDVLNQRGSPAWFSDIYANIPTAGYKGRMFISTDTYAFYRDTGTGWDLIGGPGTGTITGSGATGQVSYFNGSSTLAGSNNLFWDNTNGRLGIGTITPGQSLDIHSTGNVLVQLNNTTTGNSSIAFQNQDVAKWRIGNYYNAGANNYTIFNATANTTALSISSSNVSTFGGNILIDNGIDCQYIAFKQYGTGAIGLTPGYTSIGVISTNTFAITFDQNKSIRLNSSLLSTARGFIFPDADGTIALTSNLSSYLPLAGGIMTGSILLNNNLTISGQLFGTSSYASMIAMSPSDKVTIDNSGRGVNFGGTIGNGTYTYTLPGATGTLALTSNIPSLAGYVPYTGATTNVNIGSNSFTTTALITSNQVYIDPQNTGTIGLDVASDTIRFRSDNLEGFKRQLEITMGSGTLVQLTAKGYGANYGTDLAFYTATTGGTNTSPAIYITGTNNRVGIKTGTPSYDLDVTGTGRFTSTLLITGVATFNSNLDITAGVNVNLGTTDNTALFLRANSINNVTLFPSGNTGIYTGGSDTGERFQVTGTTRINGLLYILDQTSGSEQIRIGNSSLSAYWAIGRENNITGDLYFKNGTSTKVVFTANGYVSIGKTTSQSKALELYQPTDAALRIQNSTTGTGNSDGLLIEVSNNNAIIYNYENGSLGLGTNAITRLDISSAGTITLSSLGSGAVTATSGVLSTTSDMNLKIEDGYIDNALDKVLKLKPRYFYWKEETGLPTNIRQLGFYAQEVNIAIGEEAANTPKSKKDSWGIYDRGIIAMLTKSIQELNEKLVKNNIN
jgi:hypothetical protein